MFQKYFTPHEANQRLPLVRRIVEDIVDKGRRLKESLEGIKGNEIPSEVLALEDEIEEFMQELVNLGCYYKDWNFEFGLVDFPAIIDDKNVFLCWRSDEENIRWYHAIDDGYTGRKPIPEHLLLDSPVKTPHL